MTMVGVGGWGGRAHTHTQMVIHLMKQLIDMLYFHFNLKTTKITSSDCFPNTKYINSLCFPGRKVKDGYKIWNTSRV